MHSNYDVHKYQTEISATAQTSAVGRWVSDFINIINIS